MSQKNENVLLLILLVLAALTAVLLFFGDPNLLGDEATTEYVFKLILYPSVLVIIVLLWRRIDKRLNNDKPDIPE